MITKFDIKIKYQRIKLKKINSVNDLKPNVLQLKEWRSNLTQQTNNHLSKRGEWKEGEKKKHVIKAQLATFRSILMPHTPL